MLLASNHSGVFRSPNLLKTPIVIPPIFSKPNKTDSTSTNTVTRKNSIKVRTQPRQLSPSSKLLLLNANPSTVTASNNNKLKLESSYQSTVLDSRSNNNINVHSIYAVLDHTSQEDNQMGPWAADEGGIKFHRIVEYKDEQEQPKISIFSRRNSSNPIGQKINKLNMGKLDRLNKGRMSSKQDNKAGFHVLKKYSSASLPPPEKSVQFLKKKRNSVEKVSLNNISDSHNSTPFRVTLSQTNAAPSFKMMPGQQKKRYADYQPSENNLSKQIVPFQRYSESMRNSFISDDKRSFSRNSLREGKYLSGIVYNHTLLADKNNIHYKAPDLAGLIRKKSSLLLAKSGQILENRFGPVSKIEIIRRKMQKGGTPVSERLRIHRPMLSMPGERGNELQNLISSKQYFKSAKHSPARQSTNIS